MTLGAFAVGVLLPFLLVDHLSAWSDEGFSLRIASAHWSGFWKRVAWDVHPPGYYLFLRFWMWIFGYGYDVARYSSAIFSGILLWRVFRHARYYGPLTRLFVVVCLTSSAFYLRYSVEARNYALIHLCFFLLYESWIFWRRELQVRFGVAVFVLTAVSCYVGYLVVFPLLAIFFYEGIVFFRERSSWRVLLHRAFPVLLASVCFLPYVSMFLDHRDTFSAHHPTWYGSFEEFGPLALKLMGFGIELPLVWKYAVTILLVISVCWLLWRSARAVFATQSSEAREHSERFLLAVLWVVGTLFSIWVVIELRLSPLFRTRYLLFTIPFVYLIVGRLLSRAPRPVFVLVLLLFLCMGVYNSERLFFHSNRSDFRSAAGYIESHWQRGDRFLVLFPARDDLETYYFHDDFAGKMPSNQVSVRTVNGRTRTWMIVDKQRRFIFGHHVAERFDVREVDEEFPGIDVYQIY